MAAYQAGSEVAFGQLFERHAGSVYGFLVRRLGDPMLAEDLYQEVFLRVHRGRQSYDATRPFRAWLFGIVHNLLTDTLRSRGRAPETTSLDQPWGAPDVAATRGEGRRYDILSDGASPETLVTARQSAFALERALGTLSSDESTALILARVEGLSYADIGSILGRSVVATKQLAYRALKRVRAKMIADGHQEEP